MANIFQQLLSKLNGSDKQAKDAIAYQQFWDKAKSTSAGIPNYVAPKNPTPQKVQEYLGNVQVSTPKTGIYGALSSLFGDGAQKPISPLPQQAQPAKPTLKVYDKSKYEPKQKLPSPPQVQGQVGLSPQYQKFLESRVFPQTRQGSIPDALAAGQWAAEGRGTNWQNNNPYNMIFNGKLHAYQSLDNGVRDYVLTVQNILKNKGYDVKKMKAKDIIKALQEGSTRFEGHNKDPMQYVNLVTSTPEWNFYNK